MVSFNKQIYGLARQSIAENDESILENFLEKDYKQRKAKRKREKEARKRNRKKKKK